MNWPTVILLGACGGLIVQAVTFSANVNAWQAARREALGKRLQGKHSSMPKLTFFVDPAADVLVLLTRLGLGAGAGALFHAQVTGATAAVAVGATAPALLRQFGAARTIVGLDAREGTVSSAATSNPTTDLAEDS